MSTTLNELFHQMNNLGLTFRRNLAAELEVHGDTSKLTNAIRQAIGEHRQTIMLCLPQASPAAPAIRAADAIRQQLDEFSLWLGRFAAWAQPMYLQSIEKRLAAAVDTKNLQTVAHQIETLKCEIEAVNWAAEILPKSAAADGVMSEKDKAIGRRFESEGEEIPF